MAVRENRLETRAKLAALHPPADLPGTRRGAAGPHAMDRAERMRRSGGFRSP